MSPPAHTIDHDHLARICSLFKEAERAIKEIEDIGNELIVPAVNQLRYTGNHLVRYLADPDNKSELFDAEKHCKRATYDAYEAAILYYLNLFHKFKDDYRRVTITTVLPDYPDLCLEVDKARKLIRDNNKSKTRGEFYQQCREHLEVIAGNVKKMDACRDELNKLIKKEWRQLALLVCGVIGAAGAITAIITSACS